MTTIKDVARASGVSTATVSAVINDSSYVSPALRARVLATVKELGYAPSLAARNLRSGKSQLIALVVADLSNPFFAKVVLAAEAAVSAWGYSMVIFNSDEKPDAERRILARIRMLSCDGVVMVPVGDSAQPIRRELDGKPLPTVLFGRTIIGDIYDTVTIDNFAAGRQATNYLIDLGHQRIGTICGPLQLSSGRGRLDGMLAAMDARGLVLEPQYIRSGEFREDTAYSVARNLLQQPDPPTALYVANGVMALGVMRAIADLGLKCPEEISIASTDTIPGIGGLRPRLTRTEHPVVDMTNEAVRILIDRINRGAGTEPRNVVFQPALVVGDSCAPRRSRAA